MSDAQGGEVGLRLALRTVDEGDGLDDLESLVEEVAGRLDSGTAGCGGVLEHGDGERRIDRADEPSTGAVVLWLVPDGEGLELPTLICRDHGSGNRDRVGPHRHATHGGNLVGEDLEHRGPDQTRSSPVEGRLPGVDVPIGHRTAAQCERSVGAQGMCGEMVDEGFPGHGTIVLAASGELASHRLETMELYLVRHGQPDWTPSRIARNDPNLTELGHEQASRVGHRFGNVADVAEIWVSPMARSQETSVPVAAELGLESETYDWLKEIQNPPTWDGEPAEVIEQAFADANFRSMEEMWDGLPEGESFLEFHQRVATGLTETLDSHGVHPASPGDRHLWTVDDPDKRVVIVAHAGTNALILGHLLGLDPVPWEWDRFRQPHTGVSRLTTFQVSTGWAFSLRQLGDVTHLHPGMVTA